MKCEKQCLIAYVGNVNIVIRAKGKDCFFPYDVMFMLFSYHTQVLQVSCVICSGVFAVSRYIWPCLTHGSVLVF